MEDNRLLLRDILRDTMTNAGEEPHLYYQPPESIKLEYPCIIYQLGSINSTYANDMPYTHGVSFEATYITRNPASPVVTELAKIPQSKFDRYFVSDNLHHYVYTFSSTIREE